MEPLNELGLRIDNEAFARANSEFQTMEQDMLGFFGQHPARHISPRKSPGRSLIFFMSGVDTAPPESVERSEELSRHWEAFANHWKRQRAKLLAEQMVTTMIQQAKKAEKKEE